MKGKLVKILAWIISLLVIIMCIKVIVSNRELWKVLLATVGILVAAIVNESCFFKIKQSKSDNEYNVEVDKAENLISQNEYGEARKILEDLDVKYNEKFVKRDILRLENKIDYVLDKRVKIDDILNKAEEFADNKQFEKCKSYLYKNVIWFEGNEVIFNKYLSEEQKSRGMDLLRRCIII